MLYRLPDSHPLDRLVQRHGLAVPMLGALARRFAEWRLRRNAVLRLRDLDDHLLADIGIARDEIDVRVRHGIDRH